jgi:hypothetical protein
MRKMRDAHKITILLARSFIMATVMMVLGALPTIVAQRSGLFYGKQRGSLPFIQDVHTRTGNVFFVMVGGTDTVGHGLHPDDPFNTIDFAVGQCTANQGDVIYVMPNHTETISAAAGIDLDVAGITVIGLGEGANRPTITMDTANTVDVDVDAAGITIKNLIFSANFADIVAAIDVNADDFTIENCHFQATATNMNFLICIKTGTANQSDRCKVHRCTTLMVDTSDTHFIDYPAAQDGCEVHGCHLIGNWGTMAIGGAGVITLCSIVDNIIYNAASDNDSCINLAATATGIVMRNMAGGAAAQANGFTAPDCAIAQNYYGVLDEDLSAILEPIAT